MIKRTLWLFLTLSSLLSAVHAQSMKIASYNIRYDSKHDTLDPWQNRLPVIQDLVRFHDFDIFGTQEGMHHQLEGLQAGLPEYAYFGKGRDDGKTGGEFSAIFYKKDKYKVQKEGTFWLAPDSERPGKGWDAALPRVCTWGSFVDRQSGLSFYVFNIHFDHRGVQARKESTRLLLRKIKEIAGKAPVLLTGDFNFNQEHENYNMLNASGFLQDSYHLAKVKYAPNGTFNRFDVNRTSKDRIDFVFLTSAFEVKRYGILTDTYRGRFPSDHFPVLVEVEYKR